MPSTTTTRSQRAGMFTLAASVLLGLAACDSAEDSAQQAGETDAPGTRTIANLLARTDNLSQVEALMEEGGLAEAFDGNAVYTVLAPTDDALQALGDEFAGAEARPALLAMLRGHVVPGYLTIEDIATSIETNGGPVEMQTMGEGTLTFALDGETVTVSSGEGGASASLANEMLGANGVVIPVDAVLAQTEPGT